MSSEMPNQYGRSRFGGESAGSFALAKPPHGDACGVGIACRVESWTNSGLNMPLKPLRSLRA